MLRDLIVHLDGTEEDDVRLAHAETIARRYEAYLIGLYTNPLPEYGYVLAIQSGLADLGPVIALEHEIRKHGDLVQARLKGRFNQLKIENEVRRIDAGGSELPEHCASAARQADLFIATAPYRGEESPGSGPLVEAVLFGSGHSIYLVPEKFKTNGLVHNVLIAWSNTREAARAIAEAVPFLRGATTVRLVSVGPDQDNAKAELSDLAVHLARYGAKIEPRSIDRAGRSVADVLLNEAKNMAADLIVMGAYGHSRFREWVLGGTTREMIARSEVPLLVAH